MEEPERRRMRKAELESEGAREREERLRQERNAYRERLAEGIKRCGGREAYEAWRRNQEEQQQLGLELEEQRQREMEVESEWLEVAVALEVRHGGARRGAGRAGLDVPQRPPCRS